MSTSDILSQASSMKAKGNSLFRDGHYLESIIEYTSAIELDPRNPVMYSNRSLSFLKMGQHFFALKDAETTIQLNPEWSKGYYRKGQVEESAELFETALKSYKQGLQVNPMDEGLQKASAALERKILEKGSKRASRTRFYVMLFGLCGTSMVAMDMYFRTGILRNKLLRFVIISCTILFGMIFSQLVTSWKEASKKSLLQPPEDLLREMEMDKWSSKLNAGRNDSHNQEGEKITTEKKDH